MEFHAASRNRIWRAAGTDAGGDGWGDSGFEEAVVLAVSLVGVTGFWAGLMEIAKKAGVIDGLVKRMGPVMRFLFPEVPEDHSVMLSAGMNMICNVFGLGAAATPPGLAAMERFEELEEERRKMKNPAAVPEGTANREMCTFLILNISSLQLIPVNIIAYRSQYGSVHPTAIAHWRLLRRLRVRLRRWCFAK